MIIHTKSKEEWRNDLLDPLFNAFRKEISISNINPTIYGSKKYKYENNKCINRKYIFNILNRCPTLCQKSIYEYIDQYNFYENDEILYRDDINLNCDFYKFYERDLSLYDDIFLTNHWKVHGKNEFHRINNSVYIKNYGIESFFIAGTCFITNTKFIELFKKCDIDYEISILYKGYTINDKPTPVHAWEYLYGYICYCNKGCVYGLEQNGNIESQKNCKSFDIDIYKKANCDLLFNNDDEYKNHYEKYGKKENRITCKYNLVKKQSIINNRYKSASIAFFMIIPGDNLSGGYRTLLKYINWLKNTGFNIDIYLGYNDTSIKEVNGFTIINQHIDDIVKIINSYGEINIKEYNFYMGFKLKRNYNIIVANAWQVANSVILQKNMAKECIYIIQDLEANFFNDEKMKQYINNTYKDFFHYYCLSDFLYNYFKKNIKYKTCVRSLLGVDTSIYYNKMENREMSVILAYYTNKSNRLPNLIFKIANILQKHKIKCYVFPDKINISSEYVKNLGKLNTNELSDLYNKSKVGIVFSNSNPSRLGFEMKSCGLHVIEYESVFTQNDIDNDFIKIKNEKNILEILEKLFSIENTFNSEKYSLQTEKNILVNYFNQVNRNTSL
jgi:hypothetical protein